IADIQNRRLRKWTRSRYGQRTDCDDGREICQASPGGGGPSIGETQATVSAHRGIDHERSQACNDEQAASNNKNQYAADKVRHLALDHSIQKHGNKEMDWSETQSDAHCRGFQTDRRANTKQVFR